MEIKKFERAYLMFTREDEEINGGQSLSGYVKLEAFQGRVKINGRIQGLKEYPENIFLYLLSESNGKINFFNAGEMAFHQGKYEINKDVDNNIEKNEVINKVDGAVAVILKNNYGRQSVICPAVAFKNNKRLLYKSELTEFVQSKKDFSFNNIIDIKEIEQQREYTPEVPIAPTEVSLDFKQDLNVVSQEEQANVAEEVKDEAEDICVNEESLEVKDKDSLTTEEVNQEVTEKSEYDKYQEMLIQLGLAGKSMGSDSICAEPQTDMQRDICNDCKTTGASTRGNEIVPLNTTKLRMLFNKYFETYDPFRFKRSDYRWWKVASPVLLNNLLYQNDIKTPLLFNPQLMMAHFKYRHILIGTYSNRRYRKDYLVCGVPAVYNVDEKPFGDYCRWAQLESTKPRHGAFGYWIVYIDIKTGNFLGV